MEKKISNFLVLVFVLAIMFPSSLLAQCTPGNHPVAGIYPTSQTGIHPAAADGAWALNVTVVIPKDTVIAPFPRVDIDSATVQDFIGFPASFQVYKSTPSGWFLGNSTECMLVYGTPTSADIGVHSISMVFSAVILGFPYTDTVANYWQFEVKDPSHIGINQSHSMGDLLRVFPVPAVDNLNIEAANMTIINGVFNSNSQMVMDLNEKILPMETYVLSVSHLPAGIYYVRFLTDEGVETRRFALMR